MRVRRAFIVGSAIAALGLVSVAVLGVVFHGMVGGSGENQQDMLAGLVSLTLSTPATQVHIGAVDGVLSSAATVHDVSITDRDGVWLTLDKARLVWRRTALLMGRLEIDRLAIGTLDIKRKPLPSDQTTAESGQPILPGQRTYDTCYRARDIFGIQRAILVTQSFHLPRAIYTCNKLGVKAIGVPADRRIYRNLALMFWNMREVPATLVALWEVHVTRPQPVLGEPEPIFPLEAQ